MSFVDITSYGQKELFCYQIIRRQYLYFIYNILQHLLFQLFQQNRLSSIHQVLISQFIHLHYIYLFASMLQDTSLDQIQIQNELELINYYLKDANISQAIKTQDKNVAKQVEKDQTTTYLSYKSDQKQNKQINSSGCSLSREQPFEECQTHKFQKYLNEQLQRQQLIQQKQISMLKKSRKKKIRFIPKHSTPRNVFNFHGVDIEVVYDRFQNCNGSCLVLFYDKFNFQNLRNLTKNKELANYILDKYDETIQIIEANYQYLIEYCRSFFKNRNYNYLYLFKKPGYRSLPQFSIQTLQLYISATFRKCCYYKSSQTLVFNQFDWPGLSSQVKCQTFFWAILKAISEEVKQRKLYLKKVTICCANQNSYFQFVNTLRLISDSYIQAELINIDIKGI